MDTIKDFFEALVTFGILTELKSKIISAIIAAFILLFVFGKVAWKSIGVLRNVLRRRALNKDLHPYYSENDVDSAISYYIPTKFQNVSPSIDDEPGRNYIASAKQKLLPLFLNEIFRQSTKTNKFYLLLADSGMGKTTCMVNLYISYKNQLRNPFDAPKYEILLYPLGASDVLSKLKELPDEIKKNTILLLDAFDEDINALDNHEKRMEEILAVVWKFRTVVISCRTQFFPSEFEEPEKTKYLSFGNSGRFSFQKIYLSAFDHNDIKKYLNKKYSFYQWSRKRKARKIVEKCPNLMVRPMLLSHIGDLVDSDQKFEYAFQLYEILIDKWIKRESSKPGIIEKYGSELVFEKILHDFSEKLAIDFYQNRIARGGYFVSNKEKISVTQQLSLAEFEKIDLMTEREKRGKSLLNRDANGNYKFSHKSVLEYFIARHLYREPVSFLEFDFSGMNMVDFFLQEMFYLQELKKHTPLTLLNLREEKKQKFTFHFDDINEIITLDRLMYMRLFPTLEFVHVINYMDLLYKLEVYILFKTDNSKLFTLLADLKLKNLYSHLNHIKTLRPYFNQIKSQEKELSGNYKKLKNYNRLFQNRQVETSLLLRLQNNISAIEGESHFADFTLRINSIPVDITAMKMNGIISESINNIDLLIYKMKNEEVNLSSFSFQNIEKKGNVYMWSGLDKMIANHPRINLFTNN